jgi:hypothetical protein
MNEDGIHISPPGVYEVSFTLFVPPEMQKPSVQLKINEKPFLSTLDSQTNTIFHQDQMKHVSVTTYLQ